VQATIGGEAEYETLDLRERFERRIDEGTVAKILQCIATHPNKRDTPTAGDIAGPFDFWFDGGAATIQTGVIEYKFADGARATLAAPIPALSVTIEFPNGSRVRIQQETWD
jgi:hypothetical protein